VTSQITSKSEPLPTTISARATTNTEKAKNPKTAKNGALGHSDYCFKTRYTNFKSVMCDIIDSANNTNLHNLYIFYRKIVICDAT